MKICMLAYAPYEKDARLKMYAESLVQRGDEVDVISLRRQGQGTAGTVRGVHVFRIQERLEDEKRRWTHLVRLSKFFLRASIFLSWRYLKKKYQLIHVHNMPDFLIFAAIVPKLFGAKIILDIHDIVPEYYTNKFKSPKQGLVFKTLLLVERMAAAFSDHVIVSNDIWRRRLITRTVSETKCTTILNSHDESIFFPMIKKRRTDKVIVIYPGSLNWHQGVDIAIQAMAEVKKQKPEIEFQIYGNGSQKPYLQGLAKELGLTSHIVFNDFVALERIAAIMAEADLGVVPKRNDSFGGEAFSTKIPQLMALGVPVIVSETVIDRFYFNDSVVRFFKPGDERDLAKALIDLISNKEKRDRLSRNALGFIQDLAWGKKKAEYYNLVNRLVIG